MLPGLAPSLIRPPYPALSYIGASSDLGSGTSKTATAQNIGPDVPNKLVIAMLWYARSSGNANFNSCTIGGVSATIFGQTDGANDGFGIAGAVVGGTSADVAFTMSASAARCGVMIYNLYHYKSATAVDTDFPAGGGVATRTATLDIPENGVALGVGFNSDTSLDSAITNATELVDAILSSNERGWGAKAESVPGVAGLGIQFTNVRCVGAVSWS